MTRILTDSEQNTWDILNTPYVDDPLRRFTKAVNAVSSNYVGAINDTVTQAALTGELMNMFEGMLARRQISDYQVRCDRTNNTPSDMAQGVINCEVQLKPVSSAEIITIPIRISS